MRTHTLPALTAPSHLKGRMSRWTPQATRTERSAWAIQQARAGYNAADVGRALGISQHSAWVILAGRGYDAWAQLRASA